MKLKATALIICLILILSWSVALATPEETPSGLPFSGLEDFVDEYMEEYIGQSTPGAAVVLVKDGEVLLSKGYGYADVEAGILVDSSTVFEYGSISKLFVYTTIMRLAEQGKIDLEADIRQYLPDGFLKKLNFDKPITMLHIMSHTAGFEDYLFDAIVIDPDSISSLEDVLTESQPEQVYEPGTVSAYSNYAVALAAYIAEGMVGQEFYTYLMETMFLPLDMNDTSAHITLADKPELLNMKAKGYLPGEDTFSPGPWSYVVPYPAGSVTGTAEDLARFAIALMPEEGQRSPLFAQRDTLDEMLSQSHPMGPGLPGFAHGFIEWDGGDYRGLGHGGNTAAFSSQINIVPEERFGVIVLTNAAGEMDITSGLTEALIGKRDNVAPEITGNLPDAKAVEGTYLTARNMYNGFLELYGYLMLLDVQALEPNKIQLSLGGQTSTLIQSSPYVFERVEADGPIFEHHFGIVYFEVNDGEVQRMSGDYLPLAPGRTKPWLIASLIVAILSSAYFVATPFALLIGWFLRRKKTRMDLLIQSRRVRMLTALLVLNGTAILVNNISMVVRMLANNYRTFAEMRIQILLNYPLAALAVVLCVLLALNWEGADLANARKFFSLVTVAVLATLIGLLIYWQFFVVVTW